jgi:hypothetical protein
MKRFGAIASLLLVAAIGVGAFVYAGSDGGGGKKSSATVVKEDSNTTTPTTAKKNDPQPVTTNSVASASPTPKPSDDNSNVFHPGEEDRAEVDGYEARKAFVGVSPSYTTTGRKLQVEVRGFGAFETVTVVFTHPVLDPTTGKLVVTEAGGTKILTDKRGRGKAPAVAPLSADIYTVMADGGTSKRHAATILKVVIKK